MEKQIRRVVFIILLLMSVVISGCSTITGNLGCPDVVSVAYSPGGLKESGYAKPYVIPSTLTGEIVNTESERINGGYYLITGRLYDASGDLIADSDGGGCLATLYPGDTATFSLTFYTMTVEQARREVAKVDIIVDYYNPSNKKSGYKVFSFDLK